MKSPQQNINETQMRGELVDQYIRWLKIALFAAVFLGVLAIAAATQPHVWLGDMIMGWVQ